MGEKPGFTLRDIQAGLWYASQESRGVQPPYLRPGSRTFGPASNLHRIVERARNRAIAVSGSYWEQRGNRGSGSIIYDEEHALGILEQVYHIASTSRELNTRMDVRNLNLTSEVIRRGGEIIFDRLYDI